MFERLFLLLLHGKLAVVVGVVMVATTGFVITGTINGESVNLTVTPTETTTCVEAVSAQTETLLELDAIAQDASNELASLRDEARERAHDQNKLLDKNAVRAEFSARFADVQDALRKATQRVYDDTKAVVGPAGLDPCEDGDSKTPSPQLTTAQLAALRDKYAAILSDFTKSMTAILEKAQQDFDALVASAPQKPPKKHDDDDEEDDD